MHPSGHHVAITGGSRGIGLALAEKFLSEGNAVLLIARDAERLAEVTAKAPRFRTLAADLAEADEIDRVARAIAADFPGLDVLINNAGVHHMGDLADDVTSRDMVTEIAVNVTAPVILTQKLLPILRQNPPAAVVNVSSTLAFLPKQSAPVYCGSKAFIRTFSRSLRYQQEAKGVRVFDLIPPAVDTDMMAGRAVPKMAPAELAERFWGCWCADKFDAPIGRVRRLMWLNRLAPGLARRKFRNI